MTHSELESEHRCETPASGVLKLSDPSHWPDRRDSTTAEVPRPAVFRYSNDDQPALVRHLGPETRCLSLDGEPLAGAATLVSVPLQPSFVP